MCVTLKQFSTLKEVKAFKPKTARKNIKVWKVLWVGGVKAPQLYSPMYSLRYKLGELYTRKLSVSIDVNLWYYDVRSRTGLYSYSTKSKALECCGRNEEILEAVIPRGSKYYESNKDIMISSKLKVLHSPDNRRLVLNKFSEIT